MTEPNNKSTLLTAIVVFNTDQATRIEMEMKMEMEIGHYDLYLASLERSTKSMTGVVVDLSYGICHSFTMFGLMLLEIDCSFLSF